METLRQDFKEYLSNRREIEELKRQLNGMEHLTDTVRGSSSEWPYIQGPITVQGRNASEELRTIEQIQRLVQRCRRVEEAIQTAPNSMTRRMLRLRYKQGLKWADVAAQLGDDVSVDAVKQRDQEFFRGK
jgi:hypothetical protein